MSSSALLASGTNKVSPAYLPISSGTATLVAGTINVNVPFAATTDNIIVTRTSSPTAANASWLAVTAIDAVGPVYGFTVTSGNAGDIGTFKWVQLSSVVAY
jgi:hypothetical protein